MPIWLMIILNYFICKICNFLIQGTQIKQIRIFFTLKPVLLLFCQGQDENIIIRKDSITKICKTVFNLPPVYDTEPHTQHLPISMVPPCWALTAILARASLNRLDAAEAPCRAFRYALPALINCRAPGLNFSRIFCWKETKKKNTSVRVLKA